MHMRLRISLPFFSSWDLFGVFRSVLFDPIARYYCSVCLFYCNEVMGDMP
ncbi:hypothetical protein CIPAW_15G122800 [Carya illinoinensis]|uniref:Uncharacterized protein n=1 Tax=Carya illinoinensis TaxID=32201 RepID=A0A8T1N6N5_CARIL|nr:hypothetical protein CIPAW_15G122800 [Carya illinoinensis]